MRAAFDHADVGPRAPEPRARSAERASGRGDQSLIQSMADAFGVPVAILDADGSMIGLNRTWREFAAQPGNSAVACNLGESYLEVCEAAREFGVIGAVALKNGAKRVLGGRQRTFACDCWLIQDGSARYFQVRISRVDDQTPARFLVQHQEVTPLVEAQETAREAGERLLEAQADERQRLALELHDSVGQNLVSLGLSLSLLRLVAPRTQSLSTIINDMSDSLQEAHAQIRSMSYLLNPPWPEHEGGLENAVRDFVQGFGRRAGLRVDIQFAGPSCELDRARELTIFRILQEALVNVHRHAHANAVLVELASQGRELMLQVRDDGRGFAMHGGAASHPGVGISGMRARVRERGGELTIVSGPTGTTVLVRLPIDDLGASPADSPDTGPRPPAGRTTLARAPLEERSWDPHGARAAPRKGQVNRRALPPPHGRRS